MKGKRAQAAMEFLMTYGWAILIVVIAVAALAGFGLFDTNRFVQDTCNSGSATGIVCTTNTVAVDTTAGTIDMALSNGAQARINITDVTGTACTVGSWDVLKEGTSVKGQAINDGDKFVLHVVCSNGISGKKFDDTFVVKYTDLDSGLANLDSKIKVIKKLE